MKDERPSWGVSIRVGPRPAVIVQQQGMDGIPEEVTQVQHPAPGPLLRLLPPVDVELDGLPVPDVTAPPVDEPPTT